MGGAGGVQDSSMICLELIQSRMIVCHKLKTYLAPYMRSVFVDQSLRRIAEKKLRDDKKSNIFFAVESFLKNMASIAIGRQFNNATPTKRTQLERAETALKRRCVPHARNNLSSFFGS